MSKFSYKTLLTILFFLLIAIVILLRFISPKQKIKAAWWNDGWGYRRAISVVNNTNFDATNTPYKIEIDTQTLISNNKLQADADDIRVVNSEGKIVRYQIEKSTLNTSKTKLWFETTIKSNSTSFYYIYYGNSSASIQNFDSNINTVTSNASSVTVEMKDGFGYTTSTSQGRISDIRKNGSNLGIDGNIHYSSSYPGSWWDDRAFTQTILNSTGPLFVEVGYTDSNYGSYSSFGSNLKIFNNGFSEVQMFVTYNTSGSENFYYYLPFDNGTRNSVWVNGSGTLVDQDADSGGLTEASLGQNWFGQRWTSTGIYGGTIITKNGSDWNNGVTSTRNSYYQTNWSYTNTFTNGSSREVRFGIFTGDGGLSEMQQKGANYGALGLSLDTEEIGTAPIAYWKFDEGIGTSAYDSTSNKNNSTISGTTWASESQCISGKCLEYPSGGGGGISMPNSNSFKFGTNSFTLSAWVYLRDYTYPKSTFMITSNDSVCGVAGNTGFDIGHSYNSNGSNFCINDGTNVVYAGITYDSGYKPNDTKNKWTFFTYIFDRTSGKIKVYVNGVKQSNELNISSVTGSVNNATSNIYLSSIQGWQTDGLYDEVKIYPYARTAAQIKLDYNSRGSSKGSSTNLGIKSNTAPSLKSKLVAYWKFDEGNGTTTKNSISNNYNLTFGGEILLTWKIKGKVNKALYFYGIGATNRGYLTTTPLNIGSTGVLTFSFWINPDSSQNSNGMFMRNGLGVDQNYALSLGSPSSGKYKIYVDRFNGSWETTNSTNYLISASEWSHITIILTEGSNWKYYLNGKYIETVSISGTAANSTSALSIGGHNGANGQYFNGYLDEVKIYNSALTADEIKQDYNQGSAISFGSTNQTIGSTTTSLEYCIPGDTSPCSAPIAEYNFEENTGTSAKDTSGNNNIGTFGTGSSAPIWTVGKNNKGAGLKFDGIDDRLTLNSTINLVDSNNWTVSAWVKTSTSGLNSVLSNSSGGPVANDIGVNNSKMYYAHYYGTWLYQYGNKNIADNNWHFLTWINNSNKTMDMYVDGVGDTKGVDSAQSNGPVNQIGRNWAISSNATIDQVRIYNYARTPAQIAYDYNKGGPIGWWKLDECQGNIANDSSGVGNTGTIVIGSSGTQNSLGTCQIGTSAAWTSGASGKTNSSLNFDGVDDRMTVSDSNSLNITNQITMGVWVYPTYFTRQTVIERTNSDASGGSYSFYSSGNTGSDAGRPEIWFRKSGSWTQVIKANSQIPLNKWSHLIATYDGSNTKLYINGSLDKQGSFTGPLDSYTSSLGIGYSPWNAGAYFQGKIDDVRIYNYALTSEQVKTVYNGGAVNFN